LRHDFAEALDGVLSPRVVERGPQAADGAVALEAVEPRGRRLLHEGLLELLAREAEGDVHARAAVRPRMPAVEASALVDGAVEKRRLRGVPALDPGETAVVAELAQDEADDVDREAGRRVVERP